MKTITGFFTAITLFFSLTCAAAKENTVAELFTYYLANDSELQKAIVNLEVEKLSAEKTSVNNGPQIKLQTGTMSFQKNSDTGNIDIKLSPVASVSFPSANNLSLSASFPLELKNDGTTLKDAKLSLSAEIISSTAENKKIEKITSQRKILEANRAIEKRAINCEKEFYNELKSLLKIEVNIFEKKNTLYDDTIYLDLVKAQGYAEYSMSFRNAEAKVRSDKRSIEVQERSLENDSAIFLKKCGADGELPRDIATVEALDFNDFELADFREYESAIWSQKLAQMKRDAKRHFTLSANAGYTFSNSSSQSKSDTIDTGLSSSYRGISGALGVSLPTGSNEKNPIFSASVAFEPQTLRLSKINDKEDELNIKLEDIAINKAILNYFEQQVAFEKTLSDNVWNKTTYLDDLKMYKDLTADMEKWYEKGIVKDADFIDAKDNLRKAESNLLINKIDVIIYNCEMKNLFLENK